MLSLFCSHNFTPFERFREEHRARFADCLTLFRFGDCMLVSFCTNCPKVNVRYNHDFGAPIRGSFSYEDGETDHCQVRRCIHCGCTRAA